MTLRAFLLGCWFGSHDRVHARTAKGELVLRCQTCFDDQPVLQSEIVKGPKHAPDKVLGQPKEKATFVKHRKVIGRVG